MRHRWPWSSWKLAEAPRFIGAPAGGGLGFGPFLYGAHRGTMHSF
jgi:hypothetical protein